MIRAFDTFTLPLLRRFDAEDAHRLAIRGLRFMPVVKPRPDDARLATRAFGLNFPNPIGMAAGFDKNAEVPDALLRLGFGFVEIGSVTPKQAFCSPSISGGAAPFTRVEKRTCAASTPASIRLRRGDSTLA